jgi:hypothetical protein
MAQLDTLDVIILAILSLGTVVYLTRGSFRGTKKDPYVNRYISTNNNKPLRKIQTGQKAQIKGVLPALHPRRRYCPRQRIPLRHQEQPAYTLRVQAGASPAVEAVQAFTENRTPPRLVRQLFSLSCSVYSRSSVTLWAGVPTSTLRLEGSRCEGEVSVLLGEQINLYISQRGPRMSPSTSLVSYYSSLS